MQSHVGCACLELKSSLRGYQPLVMELATRCHLCLPSSAELALCLMRSLAARLGVCIQISGKCTHQELMMMMMMLMLFVESTSRVQTNIS